MRERETSGRGVLYGVYQARLRRGLASANLPHHVAMIIDGNRRWAKQRALETAAHGHRAGAAKMLEFLSWCDQLGVRVVTLYLLSTDNISGRASQEVGELCTIISELAAEIAGTESWRVQHVGAAEVLPVELVAALAGAQSATASRTGLHVNLAVGYGGRREIADAVRSIVTKHGQLGGTISDLAGHLTPENIAEHLYTQGQPDPDLIIRTSGEQRLSDFMLWQSAHSEFYFVEALGPDLREVDFLRALRDFATRQRRYGH